MYNLQCVNLAVYTVYRFHEASAVITICTITVKVYDQDVYYQMYLACNL